MGKRVDKFKSAFRTKGGQKELARRRAGEVQLLLDRVEGLLQTFDDLRTEEGDEHPAREYYEEAHAELGGTQLQLGGQIDNHPRRVFLALAPVRKEADALAIDLAETLADIDRLRGGDFDDLHHGGSKVEAPGSLASLASAAQRAYNRTNDHAEGLPEHLWGAARSTKRELRVMERQIDEVMAAMRASELARGDDRDTIKAKSKQRKAVVGAFKKIQSTAEKLDRQLDLLEENHMVLDLELDGEPVHLDRRALPGMDDLDEEAQQKLLVEVGAKIARGKALLDKVLDPDIDLDDLPAPGRKEIADVLWYVKTLSERNVGEPFEKGGMTLPDPGQRLRKWMDHTSKIYTRGSTHLSDLREEDPTGALKPRGMDFYEGHLTKDTDHLLPFGMRTALIQGFDMNGQERIYLKMETEGSHVAPASAGIGMGIGVVLGAIPALFGAAIGSIGGAVSGKGARQGAVSGAEKAMLPFMMVGMGAFGLVHDFPLWNPGGLVSDKILRIRKEEMVRSRARKPMDWVNTALHGLNLVHKMAGIHVDGLTSYREDLVKQKRLLGGTAPHPIVAAYAALQGAADEGPNLAPLIRRLKKGNWKKNLGVMLDNAIAVPEIIEKLKEELESYDGESGPPPLEQDDLEAIAEVNAALEEFCQLVAEEYDADDDDIPHLRSRAGGEVQLTEEDLGMRLDSPYTAAAQELLDLARREAGTLAGNLRALDGAMKQVRRQKSKLKANVKAVSAADRDEEGIDDWLSELPREAREASDRAPAMIAEITSYLDELDADEDLKKARSPFSDLDLLGDPKAYLAELEPVQTGIEGAIRTLRQASDELEALGVEMGALALKVAVAVAAKLEEEPDPGLLSEELDRAEQILETLDPSVRKAVKIATEAGEAMALAMNLHGSGLMSATSFVDAVAEPVQNNAEALGKAILFSRRLGGLAQGVRALPRPEDGALKKRRRRVLDQIDGLEVLLEEPTPTLTELQRKVMARVAELA